MARCEAALCGHQYCHVIFLSRQPPVTDAAHRSLTLSGRRASEHHGQFADGLRHGTVGRDQFVELDLERLEAPAVSPRRLIARRRTRCSLLPRCSIQTRGIRTRPRLRPASRALRYRGRCAIEDKILLAGEDRVQKPSAPIESATWRTMRTTEFSVLVQSPASLAVCYELCGSAGVTPPLHELVLNLTIVAAPRGGVRVLSSPERPRCRFVHRRVASGHSRGSYPIPGELCDVQHATHGQSGARSCA